MHTNIHIHKYRPCRLGAAPPASLSLPAFPFAVLLYV